MASTQTPGLSVAYRPEIDGLRGIAVLSVMVYHAYRAAAPGGFVGVDVFFVISGFLISSILMRESSAGTFTFSHFYERRIRRLMPTLFCVLAVTGALAWFLVFPPDRREAYHSLTYVAFFAGNIFFERNIGYFDVDVDLKPLLHTWSLGIEEQYYLLFPLLVITLWPRRPRTFVAALGALLVTSFALSWWNTTRDPTAAFFLLPMRAWELLTGALCAWLAINRPQALAGLPLNTKQGFSLAGAVLTIIPMAVLDSSTPFPGLAALIPVSGAALLLLFSTPDTWVGRVLTMRPLVGLGLVSYGAYLWHHPLLALTRHRMLDEPSPALAAALVAASIGLAWLTWRFLERPVRRGSLLAGRSLWIVAISGSLALAVFGAAGRIAAGRPASYPTPPHLPNSYFVQGENPLDAWGIDGKLCSGSNIDSPCALTAGNAPVLLLGDSHSSDLLEQFRSRMKAEGRGSSQMSIGGCAFLASQSRQPNTACARAVQTVSQLVTSAAFKEYILVANFEAHTAAASSIERTSDIESIEAMVRAMAKSGAKVTVFRPRPNLRYPNLKAGYLNRLAEQAPVATPQDNSQAWEAAMQAWGKLPGVNVHDQAASLLRASGGAVFNGHTPDLRPLYRDATHLTGLGAAVVFEDYFRQRENATLPSR